MKDYLWNLDALYKGYDDPNFIKDFDLMKNLYEEIPTLLQNIESFDDKDVVIEGLKTLETIIDYTYRLPSFVSRLIPMTQIIPNGPILH